MKMKLQIQILPVWFEWNASSSFCRLRCPHCRSKNPGPKCLRTCPQEGLPKPKLIKVEFTQFYTKTHLLKSRGPILRVTWSKTRSVCVVLTNQGRVFKFCRSHVTCFFYKITTLMQETVTLQKAMGNPLYCLRLLSKWILFQQYKTKK